MSGGFIANDIPTPITNPVLSIGPIQVTGNGGIIGTEFIGDHFGHIGVKNGFGIFESAVLLGGDGTLAGMTADGYGVRGVTINGGASVGSVIASGDGHNVSAQTYSADVRLSETNAFDPYFGFMPNRLTDIDVYTGATAANPNVPGHDGGGTDTGVIEDANFVGSRDLGFVRAYQIRATSPSLAPSVISFANTVKTLLTTSLIDGLKLVTGRISRFRPGGDVSSLTLQVAGPIRNLTFQGSVLGSSTIQATGINGNITNLRVAGSLVGNILASRQITSAYIAGNLTGTINAQTLANLRLGGHLNGGNLDIAGNVGTLIFSGDLGLPGESLLIQGSAKTIKIAGNLNANLTVQGNLGTLQVAGSIISGNTVTISNVLNLLKLDGNDQAGSTLTAQLIKHKKIKGFVQGTITG